MLGDRGWLEGSDLDWSSGPADASAAVAGGERLATDAAGIVEGEPPPPGGPGAPVSGDDGPLRAGSIDDRADPGGFARWRDSLAAAGIVGRPFDLTDITDITVVGTDGRPVLGATVTVSPAGTDGPAVELRTTADGTARLLAGAMFGGAAGDVGGFEVTVTAGDATGGPVRFDRGSATVTVELPVPGGWEGPVPLDVVFLIDATGSMADEIDRLRTQMDAVAAAVADLDPAPDVRFGMTVYRDVGDLFVTRTFDLTGDVDAFRAALAEVVADGGGDQPEALDEALADALGRPAWRDTQGLAAVELVILIADAPPHVDRQVEVPYPASGLEAVRRGIRILPVAASGTDDLAELVMRELAFATGGRFVFLSYGPAGRATGERSDIGPDDYAELPLDELVVRLIADELAPLAGDRPTPPPPSETTTTFEQ